MAHSVGVYFVNGVEKNSKNQALICVHPFPLVRDIEVKSDGSDWPCKTSDDCD